MLHNNKIIMLMRTTNQLYILELIYTSICRLDILLNEFGQFV
jgi:hypothetical protein